MIYEIPVSWIEKLELRASVYVRKWLGVRKNMSKVALYCKESPCPLPLTSMTREYKKKKASALVQLQQSGDKDVSENIDGLYTGRKWVAKEEFEAARSRIRLEAIGGDRHIGRLGLGFGNNPSRSIKSAKERR